MPASVSNSHALVANMHVMTSHRSAAEHSTARYNDSVCVVDILLCYLHKPRSCDNIKLTGSSLVSAVQGKVVRHCLTPEDGALCVGAHATTPDNE